ncbi:MAG: DUF799 family lipoprotein [Syntrophales bacterium]|nr:DUF799 family lipoprotein [Syntrophales bacterium]
MVIPNYSKTGTRLVAVLSVDNKAGNERAGQMLREKVLCELYFKGYPKIPFDVIEEKLSKVHKKNSGSKRGNVSPKVVGELLNIDAVMYCTLNECRTSYSYVWASTVISVNFELRSAETGETLWQARYRTVRRNYGFSRKDLEMKSCQVYEPAIQEIVDRALKTLPDGPDSLG